MKNYFIRKMFHVSFAGLILAILVSLASAQNMFRKVNDFDGDGRADYAVTRSVGGAKVWYIWQSTAGFRVVQYGRDTDENVPGDYDGDGKTDIAAFRKEVLPSPGVTRYSYWISGSLTGEQAFVRDTNTYPNVVGHQQDYNGDGKTDIAWTIENNERFYVVWSTGGTNGIFNPAGPNGIFVKLGDLSGDGKAENAAYHPTTRLVRYEPSSGGAIQDVQFGIAGDVYLAADFDGDAKGDITVWRPSDGNWWWLRSSDNVVNAATWGVTNDVPVPADYDGDGKTDLAIYRPGTAQSPQSYYWVYGSQNGAFVMTWGLNTDIAVRY